MNQPPDRFLTFAQVAEMIGLSEEAVRKGEGGTDTLLRIRLAKQERTTRFSLRDVERWIEEKKGKDESTKIEDDQAPQREGQPTEGREENEA